MEGKRAGRGDQGTGDRWPVSMAPSRPVSATESLTQADQMGDGPWLALAKIVSIAAIMDSAPSRP